MASKDELSDIEMVIHSSNKIRQADMFNVEFYGIPENIANVLGKHVRGMDRLNVQYDSTKVRGNRGVIRANKDQVNFDPVNISFHEDENGVVESFILSQIFRANNRMTDAIDREDADDRIYKFDVKVSMYNTAGKPTSSTTYKECFFTSLAMQNVSYDDDSNCIITCMLDYNDVDVEVVDRFINLKREDYV